ncbi:MAG TPA: hypothetical protein VGJ53_13330 [Micromonosporaceae bacterium]
MASVPAFGLVVALLALLVLPCVIAMAICIYDLLSNAHLSLRPWRDRRALGRLDKALDQAQGAPAALAALDDPGRLSIGEIAADLRRLGGQRLGVATRNAVWYAAVLRAYDDKLRLACHALEVGEHLSELNGVDLEIERVRVEGELQAVGLVLRPAEGDRRQDQL